MKLNVLFSIALLFANTAVYAGTCEMHVTRTACPGKEDISYKKCNGKAACTETEDTANAEACAAMANDACSNSRFSITKSKVITAKFDGKALSSKSGKADFCLDYENRAKEFDQCDKK